MAPYVQNRVYMRFNKNIYKISVQFVLVVFVVIATVILILFGNEIGYVNSLVVFAAFSVCGIIVISIELVSILIIAIYKTHRLDDTKIDRSAINEASEFEGPILTRTEKLQKAFDFLLLKNKLDNIYTMTAERGNNLKLKKTYIVRYADLITDLFMFMVYLIILALIVFTSRDSLAFYSTRASIRQLMNRRYFNNGTREPINTELFFEYLQYDFLPTIHTGTSFFIFI